MKVSGVYSDNMILQRDKENLIYGECKPLAEISVVISKMDGLVTGDSDVSDNGFSSAGVRDVEDSNDKICDSNKVDIICVANEDGKWEGIIPAFPAGGPYSITISYASMGDESDSEDSTENPGEDDSDSAEPQELDTNTQAIEINNVLFGDVFLLGGQSNMELTIGMIPDENAKTLASANEDEIRMFAVPHEFDFSGKARLLNQDSWKSAVKDNIAEFSAIGYYFAKEKYSKDKIPVGLIHTAVGGAPIEALMSEDNILKHAKIIRETIDCNGSCKTGVGSSPDNKSENKTDSKTNNDNSSSSLYNLEHDKHRGCIYCYEELLERNKQKGYAESVVESDLKRVASWHEDVDSRDPGVENKWQNCDFSSEDENGGLKLSMPAFFAGTKYENWFGTLWLQKDFYVSEKHAGKEAMLYLGTLVDYDFAYVNGVFVGQTDYRYPQRRYVIPAGVIKPGRNIVTVRLGMEGNVGGFLPDMPYKVTIESEICKSRSMCTGGNCSSCGNSNCNGNACSAGNVTETVEIKLTGDWNVREGAKAERLDGETFFIWHPSALFNSMIAPLKGLSVSAILFYQGESNGFAPEYYDILFSGMVDEWRGLVGDTPILFSELAVYLGDGPEYKEDSFAGVRESQRNGCLKVKDAFLIPITQLPAPYNELHPQNKADVAHMFFEKYVACK